MKNHSENNVIKSTFAADPNFRDLLEEFAGNLSGRIDAMQNAVDQNNLEKLYEDLENVQNNITGPLADEVIKEVNLLADLYFKSARDINLQLSIAFGDEQLIRFPFLTDMQPFEEIHTNRRTRTEKLLELATANRNDRLVDVLLNKGV